MQKSPREVALNWFEQVWNQRSEAAIDRLLAPTARMHGLPTPDGQPLVGPAGFKALYLPMRAAFPDIHIEVVRSVEEGPLVAVHCRVTGTHHGEGLGIAATGKPVEIWGMGMARVENGVIVEGWNAFDFMTLYQTVGLLPALSQR
jgi:predicted ester cyclase